MSAAHRRRSRAGHLVLLALSRQPSSRRRRTAPRGSYTQILCADPASGSAVIPAGTLPDGMANPSDYALMAGRDGAACGAEGIRIGQHVTTTVAHSGAALTYHAGAVKFKSAVLYRSWTGSDAWGLFIEPRRPAGTTCGRRRTTTGAPRIRTTAAPPAGRRPGGSSRPTG